MTRNAQILALIATVCYFSTSIASAAPIITTSDDTVAGILDVFYTPVDNVAEFTQIQVALQCDTGLCILDPNKAQTSAPGFPITEVDTLLNTVGSLFSAGPASHVFLDYNPIGFGSDDPPRNSLDWTAFDTLTGDNASLNQLPWHLGRFLYDTNVGGGTFSIQGFDNIDGDDVTQIQGIFGIPEPTTMVLSGLALVGLAAFRRRRVA